jgi:FlaA1/EpsC-like NDP-sugar epimerase
MVEFLERGAFSSMSFDRIKWILLDACLTVCSFVLAYSLLLYSFSYAPGADIPREVFMTYLTQALLAMGFLVLIRCCFFSLFDLYRGISRFVGMHELRQVILAVTAGTLLFALWDSGLLILRYAQGTREMPLIFGRVPYFIPIPVLLVEWMCCVVLVGGVSGT